MKKDPCVLQDDDELFWDPKAGNSDGGYRNGNANDPDRALALALEVASPAYSPPSWTHMLLH